MSAVIELRRVLKISELTTLDFPPEITDPDEAKKYFVPSFPHLRHALIGEPEVQGDALVYPVLKDPLKTKG